MDFRFVTSVEIPWVGFVGVPLPMRRLSSGSCSVSGPSLGRFPIPTAGGSHCRLVMQGDGRDNGAFRNLPVPSGVLLLASAICAIAAIGSVFELSSVGPMEEAEPTWILDQNVGYRLN